jgi:FixJ family two-component response regulator
LKTSRSSWTVNYAIQPEVEKRSEMATAVGNRVIYIVDDDPAVGKGLERLMRAAGLRPVVFSSGEDLLAVLRDDRPCCVLLDITMPGLSGLDVLGRAEPDLPVIAISARDDEHTRRRARQLGACFFLRKPVDEQALLDVIEWVTDVGAGRCSGPA